MRRKVGPALGLVLALGLAPAGPPARAEAPRAPERPRAGDDSIAALGRYQEALLDAWGGDHRQVPLEAKAAHFEWLLWRYHATAWGQIQTKVTLPEAPGEPVRQDPGADVSTWNGSLMAGLSLRYAATRDPETLDWIATLLRGLSRYQEVTGVPGLLSRSVLASEEPVYKVDRPWRAPDGTAFHYRGVPAKGTYTQVSVGYAQLAAHALEALPPAARERARRDFAALATHLVRGGWRIRDAEGKKTKYGDIRPEFAGLPIPFQSHVAWLVAATSERYPPAEPEARALLDAERARLARRHPFWVSPWWPWIHPQRLGRNRILDANDRNHLVSAVHAALVLELDAAARTGRAPDATLVRQLGEALRHAAVRLPEHRNALANLIWASVVADPTLLGLVVPDPDERVRVRREAALLLDQAVEQLRRCRLDRRVWQSFETRGGGPFWMDEYAPDNYAWKVEPNRSHTITGPATGAMHAATAYLHAYWLLRQTGLDRSAAVAAKHGPVLVRRTPLRATPE